MLFRSSGQIGTNILLGSLILLTGGMSILGVGIFGGTILDLLFGRPMDRKQESEADYIGLMMMAEACYDPQHESGHAQEVLCGRLKEGHV